jgi:hypothetical protein
MEEVLDFIRKVYYDATTGAVVLAYMMQGDIRIPSDEEDLSRYHELQPCCSTQTLGKLEWTEPDAVIEQAFIDAVSFTVQVDSEEPTMLFNFAPPEEEWV